MGVLDLPIAVALSAQSLLRRFNSKKLKKINFNQVALACLFLACKIEERPHTSNNYLKVILNIEFHEKNNAIDKLLINYQKNHVKKIKPLVRYEMILLRMFGFLFLTNCQKDFFS